MSQRAGQRGDDRWVLALDIGTSSTRAIVYDPGGNSLPELRHQEHYSPTSDEPGQSTFDADFLVDRVQRCIDGALSVAGQDAGRICAVGVTTFWHSMVGVDEAGRAITPLYTWADTRSAGAADALKERLDARAYHARTGSAIHPSYFPARLAWLRETAPDLYNRVSRWLSPGEYLFQKLFGRAACSISMASGTGLFHQARCGWDTETLDQLGISADRFSSLVDLDVPFLGLAEPFAARWPALARVPWVPAIGDGAASNLGSGCADERHIALNLGTSGAIRVLFPVDQRDQSNAEKGLVIPDDLWCYRLDRRRAVIGGAFSDGGDVAVWMRKVLRVGGSSGRGDDGSWEQVLRKVEEIAPDSHGLTFLPFLAGERSIGWRPHARGTLHGLSLSTTPEQILRAGMEAVALRFALVHERLRERFPAASEVVAAGGGFENAPFWAQITADALGAPILLSKESEATSRGAAAVALRAGGLLEDVAELGAPAAREIEPDPDHHAVYRSALARQQALYEVLLSQ